MGLRMKAGPLLLRMSDPGSRRNRGEWGQGLKSNIG